MKPTYHSLWLDYLTMVIRFWFPWVRLMECKAVKMDYPSWDDERSDEWQQKEQQEIGKMK